MHPTSESTMNVGVFGLGYWGPNLIRTLLESKRANVHCFDTNPRAMVRLKSRFPSVTFSASSRTLLQHCDAVMIATPVLTHYSLAKEALEAGKSVFVEKPLSSSSAEALELIRLAEERQSVLMVGHTFLYSPAVNRVREYIRSGVIGDLYFLSSSRVNLGIHRSDVDVILDLAPHDLSTFIYLLGEYPTRVSAFGRACVGKMLDVASLRLEFPSGVFANLEVSWLAPRKLRRMVLVGSKSMLVYDDTAVDKIQLYDRGVALGAPNSFNEYQLTYRTGDIVSPNLDVTEPLLIQTNHFLDCVEQGQTPISDGEMGLAVVRVLEAAEASAHSSGEFVTVDWGADSTSAFGANTGHQEVLRN
jgi:predicted dehydrogenase